MDARTLATWWHLLFNKIAYDLYPGRYENFSHVLELAEISIEVSRLSKEKNSLILAHYYLPPEFHELAHHLGDSLALANFAKTAPHSRIDFQAVAFMAQTAKILNPDKRVFVSNSTKALGCSLVLGTNHQWIEAWKRDNPGGILVTYINSDPYTKALSDFITTSRNTDKITAEAVKQNPGKKILILPDKYLGYVMKRRALKILAKEGIKVDPNLIEIYTEEFNGETACCYVHKELGNDALAVALAKHPDAEPMIHPECSCGNSPCIVELEEKGLLSLDDSYLSTQQMITRARQSSSAKFIVATEAGMVYALRKAVPEKEFIPVSVQAHCRFMKANSLANLLRSLREDIMEIMICSDGLCHDRCPYEDGQVAHIPSHIASQARVGIERMLTIQ